MWHYRKTAEVGTPYPWVGSVLENALEHHGAGESIGDAHSRTLRLAFFDAIFVGVPSHGSPFRLGDRAKRWYGQKHQYLGKKGG